MDDFASNPVDASNASGPLALSAIALFGNTSWFDNVIKYTGNMTYEGAVSAGDKTLSWHRMCAGMPFAGLFTHSHSSRGSLFAAIKFCNLADDVMFVGRSPSQYDLLELRREWMGQFAPTGLEVGTV